MDVHGYGKSSFQVETEADDQFKVHRVLGAHTDQHYQYCTFQKVEEELSQAFDFDANIYLVVIDNENRWIRNCAGSEVGGTGLSRGKIGGIGLVPEGVEWDLVAHELGHAFGLRHNFIADASIMSYSETRSSYRRAMLQFYPSTPISIGVPQRCLPPSHCTLTGSLRKHDPSFYPSANQFPCRASTGNALRNDDGAA